MFHWGLWVQTSRCRLNGRDPEMRQNTRKVPLIFSEKWEASFGCFHGILGAELARKRAILLRGFVPTGVAIVIVKRLLV